MCLKNLIIEWRVVELLYENGILTIINQQLERDSPQLVKVLAQLITKMVQAPEDMRLWLKFDS